ncbi:MAG: diguanylate cyclase, partial [Gammaproteobacteria bacterium]|nr:diguanylate cyclase [Gammaproteobacteria bacterium]
GIACCEPEIRHNTVESLIEAADQALYEAKAQGRNQIVISKTCKGRCQLEEFQGDHQEAGREGSSLNVNRESSRKKH